MHTLQGQVHQYVRQEWFKQREEERRRKETVVAQTVACLAKVRIPCGLRGQILSYGLICAEWRDTVQLAKHVQLPLHLLFPDVLHYRDVKEVHVVDLAQRLKDDLQLRWQVLNACSRHLPDHERGQAWISKYLCTTRWLPLHNNMFAAWQTRAAKLVFTPADSQGAVESLFIAFATLIQGDKWPHVYAWCLSFLVHYVDSGSLMPECTHVVSAPDAAEQLMDWLMHYYDPDWQCDEAVALKNLSTAWRRRCVAKEDVLLPPTTCPTYEVFECAVAAQLPPAPPTQPDTPPPETGSGRIRMSRNSTLHQPMFFDPDTVTFI